MFWLQILLLGGAGLVTYMIMILFPNALNYPGGFGFWLVTKGFFFFMTIMSILAVVWLRYAVKKGFYPQKVFSILSKVAIMIALFAIVMVILLIAVNTLWPGNLGVLSELPVFTFSVNWGSGRGTTWRAGWRCFAEQSLWHKLIGVGPDSMSAYLYSDGSEDLKALVQKRFSGLILTNAHNEWLTVLVNTGVFGLVAFGGMIVTGIQRFLKEAGRNEIVCACGFCLLAYTVNNMFSFQQSMNVATISVVFGIGGAFAVQPKELVDLKASSGKLRKTNVAKKKKEKV